MTPNHAETLSAFFDGEEVRAEALAASLQEPDAIEFLVEFARLRRAVNEDSSRPNEEFCETMRERLARGDRQRQSRRRVVRMSLAASVALAAVLGGYTARGVLERRAAIADRVTQTRQAPERASQPTAEPVAAPGGQTRDAAAGARSKQAVPSPTLRMRFADWRDTVL